MDHVALRKILLSGGRSRDGQTVPTAYFYWKGYSIIKKISMALTASHLEEPDKATNSPVNSLDIFNISELRTIRRAVRGSELLLSCTVNVLDEIVAMIDPGVLKEKQDNNGTQVTESRSPMFSSRQLIWPATLLNFCLQVLAFTANERFDEKLTITTLQDGKVASKFTFTTLLKGVSPRNPMTLDEEDECNVLFLLP
jgi:hypothetical protein